MQTALGQPTGTSPGAHVIDIARDTILLTLRGTLPVQAILPGDRVITRAGAVPVLRMTPQAALVRLELPRAAILLTAEPEPGSAFVLATA